MAPKEQRLIWIDLEMTGLNTDRDQIIEIATIITDPDLTIVAEGPVLAIHQEDDVLSGMDDWNRRQHKGSGLLERVRASRTTMEEAEAETLAFLKDYVAYKKSPMCGNSICQDRRFLYRLMPKLEEYFHYRNLDVSTVKELAMRWRPELASKAKKDSRHLALEDIRDSIEEMRFYRDHFIKWKVHD